MQIINFFSSIQIETISMLIGNQLDILKLSYFCSLEYVRQSETSDRRCSTRCAVFFVQIDFFT